MTSLHNNTGEYLIANQIVVRKVKDDSILSDMPHAGLFDSQEPGDMLDSFYGN